MGMEDYMPIIVLVACQFLYAGTTLSSRVAFVQHMNSSVFVVYRQSTAFLVTAPFAFLARRDTKKYSLGWKNFWSIFMLSFVGVTLYQNLYNKGLYLSSSSAASALGNLLPVITLVMSYTLGLEKLQLGSVRSAAKVIGIMFCVAGGVTMALFKGPKLLNGEFHPTDLSVDTEGHDTWLIGCLYLLASSCCWSLWLILQGRVAATFPDRISFSAWMCLFAALQSGLLTLITERDTQVWKLNSSLQIFSCLYAGVTSAITNFAQIWVISKKGPLFSAMFNPLFTVIVTAFASIFMHEEMYTGSLAGAVAVVIGLYVVLWGKAKDHELKEDTDPKKQSDQAILHDITDLENPLLVKQPTNLEYDAVNRE